MRALSRRAVSLTILTVAVSAYVVLSYLNTDWYPKQLKNLTRPCPAGVDPLADPTRIICQRPFDTRTGPRFYDASHRPTRYRARF